MPPKTQVNSATGIMGPSGSGKSSLLATLAKYVWRRWQKVTLYYTSDGGGFPAEIQACVAAGIIRVFRMYTRDPGGQDLSFETCQRAAQGWWPKRINPATGEVPPGVEMVPPVALRFEMRCPAGHLLKSVPSESLLIPTHCPTCKKMVSKLEMQVTKGVTQNRGFEDVGAVSFDGLTSMLAWELREMGHRAGRMELRGEEAAIGGKVTSGDLKFGGSTRSHVGFVQARGEELVHLTLGIPNLVVPPVFTMLTHEDVDERSLNIRGPKISGRAKTDEAPQWFGNMLEAAKIPALQGNGEQRILYLSEFTDERGVRHLCKHRGSPGTMPAYLIDPTEDPLHPELAFTQFNLGVFFELLDAALDKRIADIKVEFPDAPGLPEGWVEIGDSSIIIPQAAQEGAAGVSQGLQTLTTAAPAAPAGQAAPPAGTPSAPAPTVRTPRRKAGAAVPSQPPATSPAPAQPAQPAPPAQEAPGAPAVQEAPAPQPAEEVAAAAEPAPAVGPVVATPAVPSQPAAPPAQPAQPATPAPRAGVAPPPGRRPSAPAPRSASAPAAAAMPAQPAAPSAPVAATPPTPAPPTPGTPAGAAVSGPAAPAPRPPAAAPRPPAAAPRAQKPN